MKRSRVQGPLRLTVKGLELPEAVHGAVRLPQAPLVGDEELAVEPDEAGRLLGSHRDDLACALWRAVGADQELVVAVLALPLEVEGILER
jgi:hypothetical protein